MIADEKKEEEIVKLIDEIDFEDLKDENRIIFLKIVANLTTREAGLTCMKENGLKKKLSELEFTGDLEDLGKYLLDKL